MTPFLRVQAFQASILSHHAYSFTSGPFPTAFFTRTDGAEEGAMLPLTTLPSYRLPFLQRLLLTFRRNTHDIEWQRADQSQQAEHDILLLFTAWSPGGIHTIEKIDSRQTTTSITQYRAYCSEMKPGQDTHERDLLLWRTTDSKHYTIYSLLFNQWGARDGNETRCSVSYADRLAGWHGRTEHISSFWLALVCYWHYSLCCL